MNLGHYGSSLGEWREQTIVEYLLYAWRYARSFTYLISFDLHNNTTVIIIILIYFHIHITDKEMDAEKGPRSYH